MFYREGKSLDLSTFLATPLGRLSPGQEAGESKMCVNSVNYDRRRLLLLVHFNCDGLTYRSDSAGQGNP